MKRQTGNIFSGVPAAVAVRHTANWLRAVAPPARSFVCAGLVAVMLSACVASRVEACGMPPSSIVDKNNHYPDPYVGWRRFSSVAKDFEKATAGADVLAARNAAWMVCRDAQELKRFAREVDPDLRPQFLASLHEVVARASEHSANTGKDPAAVSSAVAALSASIPKFWLSPAASLRGRQQPGAPLNTQR